MAWTIRNPQHHGHNKKVQMSLRLTLVSLSRRNKQTQKANYDPDADYKAEGSDPEIKAVKEEEANSDAEYANIKLPQGGTLHQRTMNARLQEGSSTYIRHKDLRLWPCGSRVCTCGSRVCICGSDLVLEQPSSFS